jgi:glycosyltransferase involved in cell wall biosynthesis
VENKFPYKDYEIVLINNNSTDNTENECKRFLSDFPQVDFRYFMEKNQGLSFARNRGIKEAIGEILIYVDDDATVSKNYLQTYADFFKQNPQVMAAGGAIFPVYEKEEPKWFSHYIKILITCYFYEGDRVKKMKSGQFPKGGNAAYRKIVFDTIGLFNVDLGRKGKSLIGAEEKDIFDRMLKLKMEFYYLPNAILYHIIPPSKLTKEYFNNITYSIGKSERLRTLSISKSKFRKRIFAETIKWAASIILFFKYLILFKPQKGTKLLLFRWNVTKGLLSNK